MDQAGGGVGAVSFRRSVLNVQVIFAKSFSPGFLVGLILNFLKKNAQKHFTHFIFFGKSIIKVALERVF